MYTIQKSLPGRTFKNFLSLSGIRKNKIANHKAVAVVDQNFRIPLQRFIIAPHEAQSIMGRLGTRILFPANAFMYSWGAPVFEEVEIELKEVMSKRDAVRENLTTTLSDSFRESGGMLYLNASSSGENVYLHPSSPALITMPRSQNTFLKGAGIFTGQRLNNENINWQMTDIHLQGLVKEPNMLLRRFVRKNKAENGERDKIISFQFETIALGWINCDKAFSVPQEETIQLSIHVEVDQAVEIKAVLKNHNSVLPVFRKGDTYLATVPSKEKVTLVGFYQKGDDCFFAKAKVKPGKENTVQLNFEKRTMPEIKKALRKL
jgi:hypothetical protein